MRQHEYGRRGPTEAHDDGPLIVGLYLPQLRMSFGTILERTLAAEAAGFDAVWFLDHLWAPGDRMLDTLEAWTVATARAARMEETLTLLEQLFTGEPVTFEGRFHRAHDAICRPVPVQDPVPVHIGGAGRQLTLPLVRRFATWWNVPSTAVARLDELRPLAGDVPVSVQHPVAVVHPGDDARQVLEVAERRFGSWGGLVGGTAEELAEALGDEIDRGVDGFALQLTDFGTPRSITHLGEVLLPALRERHAGRRRREGSRPRRQERPAAGAAVTRP